MAVAVGVAMVAGCLLVGAATMTVRHFKTRKANHNAGFTFGSEEGGSDCRGFMIRKKVSESCMDLEGEEHSKYSGTEPKPTQHAVDVATVASSTDYDTPASSIAESLAEASTPLELFAALRDIAISHEALRDIAISMQRSNLAPFGSGSIGSSGSGSGSGSTHGSGVAGDDRVQRALAQWGRSPTLHSAASVDPSTDPPAPSSKPHESTILRVLTSSTRRASLKERMESKEPLCSADDLRHPVEQFEEQFEDCISPTSLPDTTRTISNNRRVSGHEATASAPKGTASKQASAEYTDVLPAVQTVSVLERRSAQFLVTDLDHTLAQKTENEAVQEATDQLEDELPELPARATQAAAALTGDVMLALEAELESRENEITGKDSRIKELEETATLSLAQHAIRTINLPRNTQQHATMVDRDTAARVFDYIDANSNGKLTMLEMIDFCTDNSKLRVPQNYDSGPFSVLL